MHVNPTQPRRGPHESHSDAGIAQGKAYLLPEVPWRNPHVYAASRTPPQSHSNRDRDDTETRRLVLFDIADVRCSRPLTPNLLRSLTEGTSKADVFITQARRSRRRTLTQSQHMSMKTFLKAMESIRWPSLPQLIVSTSPSTPPDLKNHEFLPACALSPTGEQPERSAPIRRARPDANKWPNFGSPPLFGEAHKILGARLED